MDKGQTKSRITIKSLQIKVDFEELFKEFLRLGGESVRSPLVSRQRLSSEGLSKSIMKIGARPCRALKGN